MDSKKLAQILSAQRGDKDAANEFIRNNSALVWSIVKRFYGRGSEPDDLFQVGCIGLIKAVQKFDPSYNVEFSTYAVPMILGEIKRFLRDDGMIKVSRSLKEIAAKAAMAIHEFQNENGREPNILEISERIAVNKEDLVMALEATARHESIYSHTSSDSGGTATLLLDKIVQNTGHEEDIANNIDLYRALQKFDERGQALIKMRYFLNKTQSEIAKSLGISQVQVSRLEKKILQQLREKLETV